jgi:hypothetical protein
VSGVPFEHLQPGTQVQFIPEVAAQGRQAKRVSIGKHGMASNAAGTTSTTCWPEASALLVPAQGRSLPRPGLDPHAMY